jgi:hypothetical protein
MITLSARLFSHWSIPLRKTSFRDFIAFYMSVRIFYRNQISTVCLDSTGTQIQRFKILRIRVQIQNQGQSGPDLDSESGSGQNGPDSVPVFTLKFLEFCCL